MIFLPTHIKPADDRPIILNIRFSVEWHNSKLNPKDEGAQSSIACTMKSKGLASLKAVDPTDVRHMARS